VPGRRAIRSGRIATLLVAAGVVAGLVAGLVEPTRYRAEATLVIQRGGRPVAGETALARQLAELADSDVVVRNVTDALRTHVERSRLHARAKNGVVVVAYDAADRVEAVRIVQQVAVDFGRLVAARFARGGESVSVFDPPHDAGRTSRHVARDAALGLLGGLLAAAVAFLARARLRLGGRLREQGRWRVSALSALVERAADRYPDRVDDWRAYLAVLRGQADGDLVPYGLDGLVREVFGPLLPPSA
jgi:hypothetical protein